MISRADMAGNLSLSATAPTKTFVLEVHTDEPEGYLGEIAGSARRVEPTEDAYLFRLHRPGGGTFWVDQLDGRFWSFHTDMPTRDASEFLHERIEGRRDLDWMWLPSMHLRHASPSTGMRRVNTKFLGEGFLDDTTAIRGLSLRLSGQAAGSTLERISQLPEYQSAVAFEGVQSYLSDPDLGSVSEGLNRMGRFAVSGDSPELHLQFVRAVVQRYRRLVIACEQRAISWQPYADHDGGGRLQGRPIVIKFSRRITDLQRFLDELLAVRRPFRLWGVPEVVGGIAEVEAVDLHVGQRLRMDIGADWMRVYLEAGCCGNTVARLVSNLQHTFDSALHFVDPELQAAVEARPAA